VSGGESAESWVALTGRTRKSIGVLSAKVYKTYREKITSKTELGRTQVNTSRWTQAPRGVPRKSLRSGKSSLKMPSGVTSKVNHRGSASGESKDLPTPTKCEKRNPFIRKKEMASTEVGNNAPGERNTEGELGRDLTGNTRETRREGRGIPKPIIKKGGQRIYKEGNQTI